MHTDFEKATEEMKTLSLERKDKGCELVTIFEETPIPPNPLFVVLELELSIRARVGGKVLDDEKVI